MWPRQVSGGDARFPQVFFGLIPCSASVPHWAMMVVVLEALEQLRSPGDRLGWGWGVTSPPVLILAGHK